MTICFVYLCFGKCDVLTDKLFCVYVLFDL